MAAIIVLALHLAIIAFNVAGCVLIPLGAWRGWHWVRGLGWRLAHLLSLAVVAIQAMLGRACFLTTWQGELSGSEHVQPMIEKWMNGLIYWPLPLWVFAAAYVAVFAYVIALWIWVRPRRSGPKRMR
jgi:hypothetical protein